MLIFNRSSGHEVQAVKSRRYPAPVYENIVLPCDQAKCDIRVGEGKDRMPSFDPYPAPGLPFPGGQMSGTPGAGEGPPRRFI